MQQQSKVVQYARHRKLPASHSLSNDMRELTCWAGLERLDDHVPHGSASDVLVQDSCPLQITLPAECVFGYTQRFLLQFLI